MCINNIKVHINFYFLAFIVYVIISDSTGIILIGVISTFLHETGHIVAMLFKNHRVQEIKIGFFHIDIVDNNRQVINYNDDLLILFAGSAFNFMTAFISMVLFYFTRKYIFCLFIYTNLAMGIMNLLPISSLDGGEIVYIILSSFLTPKTASRLYNIISLIFLMPLSLVGFIVLLNSKYNFSLLFICCYLIYTLLSKNERIYLQDMV